MHFVDFRKTHIKTAEKLKNDVCGSFCGSKLYSAALDPFPSRLWGECHIGPIMSIFSKKPLFCQKYVFMLLIPDENLPKHHKSLKLVFVASFEWSEGIRPVSHSFMVKNISILANSQLFFSEIATFWSNAC